MSTFSDRLRDRVSSRGKQFSEENFYFIRNFPKNHPLIRGEMKKLCRETIHKKLYEPFAIEKAPKLNCRAKYSFNFG